MFQKTDVGDSLAGLHLVKWLGSLGLGAALLLGAAHSSAQTWQGGRPRPSLREIVAVDQTGEPTWPYGFEDVAGDGARFDDAEQSIDMRDAYASVGDGRFWFRLYVSAQHRPGTNVTAFVFIDQDQNTATGGPAAATALDPRLVSDSSGGGYEYVVAVRGDGTVVNIWQWGPTGYVGMANALALVQAESGVDEDPLRLWGHQHGYLQGMVSLSAIGVDVSCDAKLLFRTIDTSQPGLGDLDVGQVGPCVPVDTNGDRIPDLVIRDLTPGWRCASDDACPAGGTCYNGACYILPPCAVDTDCWRGEVCRQGECYFVNGYYGCTWPGDCVSLVCAAGLCQPCNAPGVVCPNGYVCAPDGRCINPAQAAVGWGLPGAAGAPGYGAVSGLAAYAGSAGLYLAPGERVQGGACTCSMGAQRSGWLLGGCLVALLTLSLRRRARETGARR